MSATSSMLIDHRGWYYAGVRKCEWCGKPATRASHDGCYFCSACAMTGDMYLTPRPKHETPQPSGTKE